VNPKALRLVGASILLCLAGVPPLGAGPAPLPFSPPIEASGTVLQPLTGWRIDHLRVYAVRDGQLAAIPFQVDERDEKDRWILEAGRAKRRDETPGVVDRHDALVLLEEDLGPRIDGALLPPARRWAEVRVGPEAAPLGFAYVGEFDDPPPRSPEDFVRYDPAADRVVTASYQATFGSPLPTVLRLDDSPRNVLKAVRARGEARLFGGLLTLQRTERDLLADLEGWIDGPLRVVRPARYRIPLPLGFRATARVNLIFYPDSVVGHATAQIKIPPRLVPADGEIAAWFEIADEPAALLVLPTGGVGSRPQSRWAGLTLAEGRTLLIAVHPEGALARLDQKLYFSAGPSPSFGFELSGVNRLDTGEHDLYVWVALLHSPAAEVAARAAERILAPPPVRISPLPDQASVRRLEYRNSPTPTARATAPAATP
jgi:hypothetical protein